MATLLDASHSSSHGTEYADQFAFGTHFDLDKILAGRILRLNHHYRTQWAFTFSNIRCFRWAFKFHQEVWGRGQTWRLTDLWIKKSSWIKSDIKVGRFGEGEDFNSFDCDFQNLAPVALKLVTGSVTSGTTGLSANGLRESNITFGQTCMHKLGVTLKNLERGKGWNLSTDGSQGPLFLLKWCGLLSSGAENYPANIVRVITTVRQMPQTFKTHSKPHINKAAGSLLQQLTAHHGDAAWFNRFWNLTLHDSDNNTVRDMQNIGFWSYKGA